MIDFRDAQLTDAVPASLAAQPWAKSLAFAESQLRQLVLRYIDQSQIYTALDTCPEQILDVLAVCWKVEWYNTDYPLKTKRQIIKSSIEVRKYQGTKWSTQMALRSVWPDSDIEEWFDYGGEPGCFRVVCNITDPSVPADLETVRENVLLYKRESAHLDNISFMVRRNLTIGHKVEMWNAKVPRCGTLRCGTWWTISRLGYTAGCRLEISPKAEAYAANQPECGTLPELATTGWSTTGDVTITPEAQVWAAAPGESGTENTGILPITSTKGISVEAQEKIETIPRSYVATPAVCGMFPCNAVE